MTPERALHILKTMNAWRRGEPPYDIPELSMPYSPRDFGEAIDIAIKHMETKCSTGK